MSNGQQDRTKALLKNTRKPFYRVHPGLKLKLNAKGQWQGGVSASAGEFCFSGELLALFEVLSEQVSASSPALLQGSNAKGIAEKGGAEKGSAEKGGAEASGSAQAPSLKQISTELKQKLRRCAESSPSADELRELLEELCGAGVLYKVFPDGQEPESASSASGLQDGFGDPWIQWAMVADGPRCVAYEKAIAKVLKASGNINVLDVGAGKGYLSAVALEHGAKKVWALEETHAAHNLPQIFKGLGLPHAPPRLILEKGHSSVCRLPNAKDFPIHLILSELFGNDPFQEGVLPTLRQIFERLLPQKPQGVPSQLKIFFEFCKLDNTNFSGRLKALQKTQRQSQMSPQDQMNRQDQKGTKGTKGTGARTRPSEESSFQDRFLASFLRFDDLKGISFPAALLPSQILARESVLEVGRCRLDPPPNDPIFFPEMSVELPSNVSEESGLWVGLLWFRVELLPGITLSNHPLEKDACDHWSPLLLPLFWKRTTGKHAVVRCRAFLSSDETLLGFQAQSERMSAGRGLEHSAT